MRANWCARAPPKAARLRCIWKNQPWEALGALRHAVDALLSVQLDRSARN
jgi:hypothetical protein